MRSALNNDVASARRTGLPARSAVLEYLVTDDEILAFVITPEDFWAAPVTDAAQGLPTRIDFLRDRISRRGNDWKAAARGLYESLVQPIRSHLDDVDRLYIVPHQVLHYLPFSALVNEDGQFLVEEYSISYLPSLALLRHTSGPETTGMLSVAPARTGLKYAVREAEALGRRAGSTALLNADATESAFKQQAPHYRVIHLATHGISNKLNPQRSGLVLEPDDAEDGELTVREILDLELSAELVTLGACRTAVESGQFSDVPPGDDFVGLTRAFLMAGSRSVLATLWDVEDESTLNLMTDFYRDLTILGTTESLATAQRRMIQSNTPQSHPAYWAPFVLVSR